MFKKQLCVECGKCFISCNHSECKPFKRCIHACGNGALSVSGYEISADDLAKKLKKHKKFLEINGGGVTISGGEPLLQSDFVIELSKKLKGMHLAIQTSGYGELEIYKKVISEFDYIMQDIKLADTEQHIKYTGVSNEKILTNINWLKKSGKAFVFRVPLVPSITDTKENLMAISKIVGDDRVELLSYNPLAGAKYEMLGKNFSLSCDKNRNEDFTKYFKNAVML